MAAALTLTALAPVVAITTESVEAGATPPVHVLPVAHGPPVAVLVIVAASNGLAPPIKYAATIANNNNGPIPIITFRNNVCLVIFFLFFFPLPASFVCAMPGKR